MFCETSLFVLIKNDTTIWEALTPCLCLVWSTAIADMLMTITLVTVLLIYVASFRSNASNRKLSFSALVYTKTAIPLALVCLAIFQVFIAFFVIERRLEFRVNSLSNLLFAIFSLISYQACVHLGMITLGILHFAWLVKLTSFVPLSLFLFQQYFSPVYPYFESDTIVFKLITWIFIFYILGSLAMVGLLCRADTSSFSHYSTLLEDDDGTTKQVCPEESASSISSLLLWFTSSIIRKGLSSTINYDDIWALERGYRTGYLNRKFETTGLGYSMKKKKSFAIFFWRLLKFSWDLLFVAISISIFAVVTKFFNSILLRVIVNSVQEAYPLWYSLSALLALYFLNVAQNILLAKRDYVSFISYSNLKAALLGQIFMKMLRLSASSRAKYSTGEVMNLITTDIQRLRLFWFQLRDYIYCPLIIIVSIFGLYLEIGWNTVYGVLILMVVLPINYYISYQMSKNEQYQMKVKDSRLKLVNDMLSGMKVLKLYAWEKPMQKMVAVLRDKELVILRRIFFLDGVITVSFQLGPALALLASFYGYTIIDGKPLTPDVAFVSLMFFFVLRFALCQLPNIIANTVKALVSARRILRFLNEQEQQDSHIRRILPPENDFVIVFDKCTYTWGTHSKDDKEKNTDSAPNGTSQANGNTSTSNGIAVTNAQHSADGTDLLAPPLHLVDISLKVKRGELVGIVGRVGNGKSSLLSAILGEMDCVESKQAAVFARTIGYVPQQPWIQNKTLRDNILFDKPFDETYYGTTISACSLNDDLKLLCAGDMTEIGEKGINLSGGQRARVALARAVYQQADLYILDDVLSAVDSHVAAHIFEKVIGPSGLLKNTTRIFALNTLSFLKYCDRIIVMSDGRIDEIGTFSELLANSKKNGDMGTFATLMREYLEKQAKEEAKEKSERKNTSYEADNSSDVFLFSHTSDNLISEELSIGSCPIAGHLATSPISSFLVQRQISKNSPSMTTRSSIDATSIVSSSVATFTLPTNNQQSGRLIEDEERATGVVSRRVYWNYLKAFGVATSFFFVLTTLMGSVFEAFSNVWLAKWTSQANSSSIATTPAILNLGIYGLFGMGSSLFLGISTVFMAFGAYAASIKFHDGLVFSLLRAPMAFFDRTPLGRIINRLSTDIDKIDENIPFLIGYMFLIFASTINAITSILIVIPSLIVIVIPIVIIFLVIMYYFTKASVQFRRLSSTAVSMCNAFFQDAYSGVDSIRAYQAIESSGRKVGKLTDLNNECVLTEVLANRWIQIRLDILTNTAIFLFVLLAIILGDEKLISIGSLALVINSGIAFSGNLGEVARVIRELEVQIVAVERVQEYMEIDKEAEWQSMNRNLPVNWPQTGEILFDHFQFRYRADTEIILKDMCLRVAGGTKVGIVGRTGAGKSSITMALFRIVEPDSGRILIDGVDITAIGLHELRKVLTIIPQEPVLFCGTLRTNLDPFEEFDDEALWSAIEKANLKDLVKSYNDGLQHEISESGTNLSVGQRQLVCLARALLRSKSARILILDEATAAIDPETDRLIQLSIREDFQNCTILTIAHRINTVLDYDRILVMDAGRVIEYDTPQNLLSNDMSMFASLCKHAGILSLNNDK